jgi:hypothetical protein
MNPRDRALVLCVDEKSQMPALNRTQSDFLLRDLAQQYSTEGLERLVAIMRDPKTKPETVATVVGMIWDRGFGRAPASLDVKHRHTMAEEFDAFIRQLGRPAALPPGSNGDVLAIEADPSLDVPKEKPASA